MHLRNIFLTINKDYKKFKIKYINDLKWVKNTRCSWRSEDANSYVDLNYVELTY